MNIIYCYYILICIYYRKIPFKILAAMIAACKQNEVNSCSKKETLKYPPSGLRDHGSKEIYPQIKKGEFHRKLSLQRS